jgi:hypothetical protein
MRHGTQLVLPGNLRIGAELAQVLKVLTAYILRMALYWY